MIQIQVIVTDRKGKTTIECNLLEREDTNEMERKIAHAIEQMHEAAFDEIAKTQKVTRKKRKQC